MTIEQGDAMRTHLWKGLGGLGQPQGAPRALLQYKSKGIRWTQNQARRATHSNQIEIPAWVRALNSLGYSVDLFDRGDNPESVKDVYSLHVGLAVGGSGRHFPRIVERTPSARHLALATTPHPLDANQSRLAHFQRFNARNNSSFAPVRILGASGFTESLTGAEKILVWGMPGSWSEQTYLKRNLPAVSYGSVGVPMDRSVNMPTQASSRRFLCVAGTGLVDKGIDLVVAAFAKRPQFEVDIFGPPDDPAFRAHVLPEVRRADNIRFHGFKRQNSRTFRRIARAARWQILPSPSEGTASSVITLMAAGKIPVTTLETFHLPGVGRSLGLSGPNTLHAIAQVLNEIDGMSTQAVNHHEATTLEASRMFSIAAFESSILDQLLALGIDGT